MDSYRELLARTESALRSAGCVAADLEAAELIAFADGDREVVEALVEERSAGVPFAWLVGWVDFCGVRIRVDRGVYAPRWQSEPLALRASELLPDRGVAVDLGTGSGAIAAVLQRRHRNARVIGTEIDPIAVGCARRNGVEVAVGSLFSTVSRTFRHAVDVVVGVLPYVPSEALHLLPRDVIAHEPLTALDGGDRGLVIVGAAIAASAQWLRPGGHLLLEIGGEQGDEVTPLLQASNFTAVSVVFDTDGDPRAIEAVAVSRHLSHEGDF